MKLHFSEQAHLPAAAWCAIFHHHSDIVEVFHGASVETRDDAFFEAVWNGPFDTFDPTTSSIVCGTGAVIKDKQIFFTTSTDKLSSLFSIQKHDCLYVSNSLVFVMKTAQEEPDDCYPFYPYQLIRIWRMGLNCLDGRLPLKSGRQLSVHMNTVMSVNKDGQRQYHIHPPGEEPRDYASYHALLLNGLQSLLLNAADPARKNPYKPLAAISRGYDSTATAALAAQVGCTESFSFTDSRSKKPSFDSGKENARLLGMECHERSRWQYLEHPETPELEFAMWGISMQAPIMAFEDHLQNRIVIGGYQGDQIWHPIAALFYDKQAPNWSNLSSGIGQNEYRLRVGYLVCCPASIGSIYNRAITRIQQSEEMKPWSIGGEYDRPFPRRLAEEAGLARTSFGISKRASGHNHFGINAMLSASSLADYQRFMDARDKQVSAFALLFSKARTWWRHTLWKLFCIGKNHYQRWAPWRRYIPFLFNRSPIQLPWKFLFSFQWCFHGLKERYQLK